jgi:quercetin dioxygenase-like cupin family protein
MQSITDITPKEIVAGITGYYAHGTGMTFGYVEIRKGSDLPAHQHPHEQITYIIDGRLDMTIGGTQVSLTAGMYYIIPSNVAHSAIAITDCKVIDVFHPTRDDYR